MKYKGNYYCDCCGKQCDLHHYRINDGANDDCCLVLKYVMNDKEIVICKFCEKREKDFVEKIKKLTYKKGNKLFLKWGMINFEYQKDNPIYLAVKSSYGV